MKTAIESSATPPGRGECLSLLDHVLALPADSRVAALERMARDASPDVREQVIWVGAAILSRSAAPEGEEELVGLLARILERLPEGLEYLPVGFRPALAARLANPSARLRLDAARCLLVLGPSDSDDAALQLLVRSTSTSDALPAALAHRGDLAGGFLASSAELLPWGLLLAARFPAEVPVEALLTAISRVIVHPELLPLLVRALEGAGFARLGEPLLRLYLLLDGDEREILAPSIQAHAGSVQAALFRRRDVEATDRLVLSALLGRPVDDVVADVLSVPLPLRPPLVARLLRLGEIVRRLPWHRWLLENPAPFTALAAEAAGRFGLRELLPALRERTAAAPTAVLVRALGELADRESVPLLLALLTTHDDLRPVVLESLGRIGGGEARAALREIVRASHDVSVETRKAFCALATCAGPGDEALLRQGATHPDWYVRWTVIDPLARWTSPDCQAALLQLAADPVSAVADRALSAISG